MCHRSKPRNHPMKALSHHSRVLLVCVAIVTLLLTSRARAADEPLRIDTGLISGARAADDSEVRVYKGIPYAAPQLGALRWQPPRAVQSWQGVRDCSQFGAVCPQLPYPAGSI